MKKFSLRPETSEEDVIGEGAVHRKERGGVGSCKMPLDKGFGCDGGKGKKDVIAQAFWVLRAVKGNLNGRSSGGEKGEGGKGMRGKSPPGKSLGE